MSKIIKLTSENVKRLHAVEITPAGNVVVIGGKNGAGKSSVLDSIEYALGGDPAAKMPVRRGESKAKVVVDLGDIVVKRTFTAAGGTTLVVTNADGAPQKTPQAILDRLVGKLTFDPLAFSREKPEKQAETLRGLVGLDFTEQDAEYDKLFQERAVVNREAKALQARIAATPRHEDAPDVETSAADILAEQEKASKKNAANAKARVTASNLRQNATATLNAVTQTKRDIATVMEEIEKLQSKLTSHKALLAANEATAESTETAAVKAEQEVAALVDDDLTGFQNRISEVETNNRKVRQNAERAKLVEQFKAKSSEADKLTDRLEALESAKREATTKAKYPVEGLMFDAAGGVSLNSIPFDQCSAAEQLKVSVAVGLALNPKLRILLIRDGSLLDDASMATVLEMAKSADAQVWMERVGTDAQTSVVIEDGSVAASEPEAQEEAKLL